MRAAAATGGKNNDGDAVCLDSGGSNDNVSNGDWRQCRRQQWMTVTATATGHSKMQQ